MKKAGAVATPLRTPPCRTRPAPHSAGAGPGPSASRFRTGSRAFPRTCLATMHTPRPRLSPRSSRIARAAESCGRRSADACPSSSGSSSPCRTSARRPATRSRRRPRASCLRAASRGRGRSPKLSARVFAARASSSLLDFPGLARHLDLMFPTFGVAERASPDDDQGRRVGAGSNRLFRSSRDLRAMVSEPASQTLTERHTFLCRVLPRPRLDRAPRRHGAAPPSRVSGDASFRSRIRASARGRGRGRRIPGER